MKVSLKEYAEIHDLNHATVRKQVQSKKLHVIGRDARYTYVDSEEKPISYSYVSLYGKQPTLSNIFRQMKARCYNPNNPKFKWYGGKGVRICDEWLKGTRFFIEWAFNNGYKDGLSIDRIDPNKDYCPDNCRWVTRSENSKRAVTKRK